MTANDPFPYHELRNSNHAYVASVWRAHKEKRSEELSRDGQRLAKCLQEHREWWGWWERADDLGDAEVVTAEGVNPFAAVTVEAIAEGLIEESRDAQRSYQQMQRDGLTHEEARTQIAAAFTGVIWEAGTGKIAAEDYPGRLRQVFRRLTRGESAEEIFGG